MSLDMLDAAIASTRSVLAQVRADQYGQPTPCASWDVQGLVDHLISEAPKYFLSVCEGRPPESGADPVSASEALALYDERYARVVGAFRAPGLLENDLTMEFGPIPAAAFLGIATNDVFVHGWDLAKATGQPAPLDAGVAEYLVGFTAVAIQDAFRGPEGALFGPRQVAPEVAPPADVLAAFLGRSV